jgi:hypothetical protein
MVNKRSFIPFAVQKTYRTIHALLPFASQFCFR